jgi:hypothetical protein
MTTSRSAACSARHCILAQPFDPRAVVRAVRFTPLLRDWNVLNVLQKLSLPTFQDEIMETQ